MPKGARKTRKQKKGSRKRQSGGYMTDEEYKAWKKKTYEEVKSLLGNTTRLYDPTLFKDPNTPSDTNDGDYSRFKYTYLQPGQIFFFRSRQQVYSLNYQRNKYTWVDYTGGLGKTPFLTAPPADATDETSRQLRILNEKLTGFFGEWLNFIEIKKPIKIIHFPVDYDGDTLGMGSYSSNKEGIVKGACVEKQIESCANGYTLDFLWRITQERTGFLKGINLQGFREMALRMESPENVKFLGSTKVPVGMTLDQAKVQLASEKLKTKVYNEEWAKILEEKRRALAEVEGKCAEERYKVEELYQERVRRLQSSGENVFPEEFLPGTA